MSKSFTTKIFLFLALLYNSFLFYVFLDLKRYKTLLYKNRNIFGNKTVDKLINSSHIETFRKKELQNILNQNKTLLVDLTLFWTLLLINLLFYNDHARNIIIKQSKKYLKRIIDLCCVENDEKSAVLIFYTNLMILANLLYFTPFLSLWKNVLLYFCYVNLLILNQKYIYSFDITKIRKRMYFLFTLTIFLVSEVFHTVTIHYVYKDKKGKIPAFLRGEPLELATKHFDIENIYFNNQNGINMCSSYKLFTNILIILGNWASFTKKEITSVVAHEIGHGGIVLKYFTSFVYCVIKVFSLYIYSLGIKLFSKRFETKSEKIRIFLR
ncbi:hypothetical protein H312_02247 [Anncaliia algerae PRA339]|uniref:Uncharacterized protein n=1 Tax=Anncaliia algerae PRA339 TaxID=1288291 RepID=A0A059EZI9_9MICR|nr:hypothetical protein H312_02247 [Anncaliia algerae PRA339]